MSRFFVILIFLVLATTPKYSHGQSTYYTSSKSCGSCGGNVSINSRIGMSCPHCGVRWGYENKKYSKKEKTIYRQPRKQKTRYVRNFSEGQMVFARSSMNVRSGAGINFSIKDKISNYIALSIVNRKGDWYYVSYYNFDNYNNDFDKRYGYVAGWLLKAAY